MFRDMLYRIMTRLHMVDAMLTIPDAFADLWRDHAWYRMHRVSKHLQAIYFRMDDSCWRMFVHSIRYPATISSRLARVQYPIMDALAGIVLRIDSRILIALENGV